MLRTGPQYLPGQLSVAPLEGNCRPQPRFISTPFAFYNLFSNLTTTYQIVDLLIPCSYCKIFVTVIIGSQKLPTEKPENN
jgi:hypothetical protein